MILFKTPAEDILTEEELKGIAIEQMETAEVIEINCTKNQFKVQIKMLNCNFLI